MVAPPSARTRARRRASRARGGSTGSGSASIEPIGTSHGQLRHAPTPTIAAPSPTRKREQAPGTRAGLGDDPDPVGPQLRVEDDRRQRDQRGHAERDPQAPPLTAHHEPHQPDARCHLRQEDEGPEPRPAQPEHRDERQEDVDVAERDLGCDVGREDDEQGERPGEHPDAQRDRNRIDVREDFPGHHRADRLEEQQDRWAVREGVRLLRGAAVAVRQPVGMRVVHEAVRGVVDRHENGNDQPDKRQRGERQPSPGHAHVRARVRRSALPDQSADGRIRRSEARSARRPSNAPRARRSRPSRRRSWRGSARRRPSRAARRTAARAGSRRCVMPVILRSIWSVMSAYCGASATSGGRPASGSAREVVEPPEVVPPGVREVLVERRRCPA